MIDITIRKNSTFNAVRINETDLGLFDEKESIELAKELIAAAETLLPPEEFILETFLITIRENLGKKERILP